MVCPISLHRATITRRCLGESGASWRAGQDDEYIVGNSRKLIFLVILTAMTSLYGRPISATRRCYTAWLLTYRPFGCTTESKWRLLEALFQTFFSFLPVIFVITMIYRQKSDKFLFAVFLADSSKSKIFLLGWISKFVYKISRCSVGLGKMTGASWRYSSYCPLLRRLTPLCTRLISFDCVTLRGALFWWQLAYLCSLCKMASFLCSTINKNYICMSIGPLFGPAAVVRWQFLMDLSSYLTCYF